MFRKLAFAILGMIAAATAVAVYVFNDRPSLEAYAALTAPRWDGRPGVTATFLGVSTVLISDGETNLMTDGFFSRPGLWDVVMGEVATDSDRINDGLAAAGVHDLDAVIVLHSHYDHAMDAPEVAERTGAVLVGSESTANIARGWGLPPSQMVVPQPGVPLAFGQFSVTMIVSRHLPHGMAEGNIDEPLVPPVGAMEYREGTTYIVHIEHPSCCASATSSSATARSPVAVRRSLGDRQQVGSAGFIEGALGPYASDVVLLGVGGLSKMTPEYRRAFYDEVLGRLRPRRVFPIHYDDFTRALATPLELPPRALDDFDQTMAELRERSTPGGFEIGLLPVAEPAHLLPIAE